MALNTHNIIYAGLYIQKQKKMFNFAEVSTI